MAESGESVHGNGTSRRLFLAARTLSSIYNIHARQVLDAESKRLLRLLDEVGKERCFVEANHKDLSDTLKLAQGMQVVP